MVKIDGSKIQEIKDHYLQQAENELVQADKDPDTELSDDDILAVQSKWEFQANDAIQKIMNGSPEKIFKAGFALDPNGWRAGYTKPLIKDKTAQRRKKTKLAKQTRRTQRRK
jgi:hypothetical protein